MRRFFAPASLLLASTVSLHAGKSISSDLTPGVIVSTAIEPVAPGKF